MLIVVLILLLSLQQRFRAHCETIETTLPNNIDVKLVDLLKQHLRRNNDDYVEKSNHSKVLTPALDRQGGAKPNEKQQQQHTNNSSSAFIIQKNVKKDANRRQLNFDISSDENDYYNSSKAIPSINPNRFQKTQPTAYSEPSLNKNADKLKQFIDKNQELLQQFLMNKMSGAESQTMPIETSGDGRERGQALALRAGLEDYTRMPAQRELDMAPAIGGRIYSMRLKGRLCDRSVLVPEGPKYNSKGKIYLKAFQRQGKGKGRGRKKDYPNTKMPKLVLPKCCNCCKKSVLGCD